MVNVCSNALVNITHSHQVYVIDVTDYVRLVLANINVLHVLQVLYIQGTVTVHVHLAHMHKLQIIHV